MPEIPKTMRAAVIDRFGGPDELETRQIPVPAPDDDEILIRVHTAGVGVWDPIEREGRMTNLLEGEPRFPYVLGSDAAGTVALVGDEVDRFEKGDEVYACAFLNPKGGCYAEYLAVSADRVMPLPEGLDLTQAGAMPIDGVTALRGLRDELEIEDGQTVAVFGASGGVGHLAVQLAGAMGATVLGIASGSDGVALVSSLGADAAVDGHTPEEISDAVGRLAPNGLDAALLTASGEGLETLMNGIRRGGRVAWPNGVHPEPGVPDDLASSSYDGFPDRDVLEEMNRLIESGPFVVHVDEEFGLGAAAEAHRALDDHYRGKLAIRIQG